MSNISEFDAQDLCRAYRNKQLSPVDVVDDILARIDRVQPVLNAFTVVDHEAALKGARASEARWMQGAPGSTTMLYWWRTSRQPTTGRSTTALIR